MSILKVSFHERHIRRKTIQHCFTNCLITCNEWKALNDNYKKGKRHGIYSIRSFHKWKLLVLTPFLLDNGYCTSTFIRTTAKKREFFALPEFLVYCLMITPGEPLSKQEKSLWLGKESLFTLNCYVSELNQQNFPLHLFN